MKLTLEDWDAERGHDDDGEDFTFNIGDLEVTLPRPTEVHASVLMNMDNPGYVLQSMVGAELFAKVMADPKATVGFIGFVLGEYNKFYGIGGQGEGVASPPTSIGSARPSKQTSRRSSQASA